MKRWIVTHITHREISDTYKAIIGFMRKEGITSVLDVAPPHRVDVSKHVRSVRYTSIGLYGKRPPDIMHDLSKTPYPVKSKSYDLVVFSHILEHFSDPWREFAEGLRIAKKYVIVVLPLFSKSSIDGYGGKKMGHKWEYRTKLIYGRPNGKYMPMFVRKLLSHSFAKGVFFIMKVSVQRETTRAAQ